MSAYLGVRGLEPGHGLDPHSRVLQKGNRRDVIAPPTTVHYAQVGT